MAAFLFTLAIFLYWMAIGHAVVCIAPARVNPRQAVMLAPAVGAATATLPIFWLNQLGWPVESYAAAVLAGLGLLAVAIIAWKRPPFPARRMRAFFAILLAALLLAGWPMLRYGLDWAGYNNSDMTHYGLGTLRVLHNGFFDPPDPDAVVRGTDHSVYDAYKYILYNARSGSERMLAALWAATGLNAHVAFMPLIMALHLVLVSSAAAMVAGARRPGGAPLVAAALMAISPLVTLGAMYQLIAQVAGLAFLCASVALLYRAPRFGSARRLVPGSIPLALAMAGLFIWYPELLPFLGLGWFVYVAMLAWRERRAAPRAVTSALMAGVLLLALLSSYFVDALRFMFSQARSTGLDQPAVGPAMQITESAFPYFLVPSGLPNLWGFLPIAGDVYGFWGLLGPSPMIAFSIGFSLWFLTGLAGGARRASAATAVFVVMAVLAAVLFRRNQDFGLFKLAMYAQPFLVAMLAERLRAPGYVARSKALAGAFAAGGVLAVVAALASQYSYVAVSTGEYLGGLNEVWRGSSQRITARYREAVDRLKAASPAGLVSDTASIVHLQHQTLHTRGYSALYPAMGGWTMNELPMYPALAPELPAARRVTLGGTEMTFALAPRLREELAARGMVTIPRFDSIVNAARAGGEAQGYYRVYAPGAARDHLVFMPTDKGAHYYGYSSNIAIAVNHLEHDPMFPGRQLSGLGRNFLFLVVNPGPRPRLVVEATATVMKHFASALPKASVHGAARHEVGFVGRGSGRVVSEPLSFASIDGLAFFALDMGRDARPTPFTKTGLMALYGTSVNPDLRRLAVYGRDISLISDEEYRALAPPSELRAFPADLGHRGLEYSGIYEDGYVSEESFFVLKGTAPKARLRIAGLVPGIDDMKFTTRIHVAVDGQPLATREVGLGDFAIDVPLPGDAATKRRVQIRFDRAQKLPGGDDRITGAKLSAIAIVPETN